MTAATAAVPRRRASMASTLAVLRHRDVLATVPAGALLILLGYYLLLAQVTSLHTLMWRVPSWPVYMWGLAVLGPATVLLFALNAGVFGLLLRARVGSAAPVGTLAGGLLGGFGAACPSCGAFLLSAVGVGAGLSALPFAGLELWAGAAATMAATLVAATARLALRCDAEAPTCAALPAPSWRHLAVVSALGLAAAVGLAVALAVHEPW